MRGALRSSKADRVSGSREPAHCAGSFFFAAFPTISFRPRRHDGHPGEHPAANARDDSSRSVVFVLTRHGIDCKLSDIRLPL